MAQRLGRLLRPKHDGGGAVFYSVVSRDTLDRWIRACGWASTPSG